MRKLAAKALPTDAVKLEEMRETYRRAGGTVGENMVDKIDAHRRALISAAEGKDQGFSRYSKEPITKKLTGAQAAKYDPKSLGAMNNMRALGHEFKPGASWRPDKVVKKGWKNLGEDGGGYMAGKGYGKYMPLGGKAMSGMFALGDAKDAVNRSDPTGEGRSRTERAGYMIGGALGGTAGALSAKSMGRLGVMGLPANIGLSLAGMAAGYYAGGKLGKGVDYAASKARGVEAGDYTRTQKARIKKKLRSV